MILKWLAVRVLSIAMLVVSLSFVLENTAEAVTGWVGGTFKFVNRNGSFCPSTANCTGSKYPQSQFNVALPISNGAVWVINASGTLVGSGATGNDGSYTVSWSAPTRPSQIAVLIFPYQRDGRFFLADTAGGLYNASSGFINTASSSSSANPQQIGTLYAGSSTAPDKFFNAYWAGERQWREVLSALGTTMVNFTYVEVRGFSDNIPGFGNSPSSSSWGPNKRVQLDANAAFLPQVRIMHEMGHIAEYLTHPWQITNGQDYTWGGAFGWLPTFAEFGSAAFEEAFATHYGNITFWSDNSVVPTSCGASQSSCYVGGVPMAGTDMEATSYPYSTDNCSYASSNPEARWPLSASRFFWDLFDNRNDADGDSYSANQAGHFARHLNLLASYPEGTEANQIDEAWDPSRTMLTERDGRGTFSYLMNYNNNIATVGILWLDNCSPK